MKRELLLSADRDHGANPFTIATRDAVDGLGMRANTWRALSSLHELVLGMWDVSTSLLRNVHSKTDWPVFGLHERSQQTNKTLNWAVQRPGGSSRGCCLCGSHGSDRH